jgi:hypothetical protein
MSSIDQSRSGPPRAVHDSAIVLRMFTGVQSSPRVDLGLLNGRE